MRTAGRCLHLLGHLYVDLHDVALPSRMQLRLVEEPLAEAQARPPAVSTGPLAAAPRGHRRAP